MANHGSRETPFIGLNIDCVFNFGFVKICILYGFPLEMHFSHHESGETSGEKSISHGKPYKMHFLAYFTL